MASENEKAHRSPGVSSNRRLELVRDLLAIVAILFPITLITGNDHGLGAALYLIGVACMAAGGSLGLFLRYREKRSEHPSPHPEG